MLDQETVARETKKNKKNNKKRGKVKIVAGIMTREQESDSTLSPEKEEGGVETPSSQRLDGRQGYQRPLHGGYLSQPVITPKEVIIIIIIVIYSRSCLQFPLFEMFIYVNEKWYIYKAVLPVPRRD